MQLGLNTVKVFAAKSVRYVSDHAPTILVVTGIACFCATVGEAIHATPKAVTELEALKAREEGATIVDKGKVVAKNYWRTAVLGTLSVACFIGAQKENLRRQAALTAACSLSEKAFKEYKEKIIEQIGETKEDKIDDMIAQDKISSLPPTFLGSRVPGEGALFMIDWSGAIFRANIQTLKSVINDLNDDMFKNFDGEITLNDCLSAISRECNAPTVRTVPLGEQFIFRPDLTGKIDLNIKYGKAPDGEPMGIIRLKPKVGCVNSDNIYYPYDYGEYE